MRNLMRYLFGIPGKPSWFAFTERDEKDGVITYCRWEKEAKKYHPIRYFLSETFPSLCYSIFGSNGKLGRAWYWLKR